MAITRILQAGAESRSLDEFTSYQASSSISAAYSKTGSYSFFLDFGQLSSSRWLIQAISATRQVRFGFFWHPQTITTSNVGELVALRSSGGVERTRINFSGSDASNPIYLYVNGSLVGTRSSAYVGNTWIHVGMDVKIDSSAGWVKLFLDGTEIFYISGNTGNADIIDMEIGDANQAVGIGDHYFDDIYLDDTTGESVSNGVPIKRFYCINPTADGTYSQWNPLPTGSHYANVDERPPDNDTTYLEAVTGSLLDGFDMSTFTLDNNELIIAMIPFTFAKRGGTTEQISLGTRSSGTNLIGSAQNLSTSYSYVWERQVTGSLGFEWNQSYMDSVELLINSTGTY